MSSYLDTLISEFLTAGQIQPQQSAAPQQAGGMPMGGVGSVSMPQQVQVMRGGSTPIPMPQGPGGGGLMAAAKAYEETQNQRLPGIAGGLEGLWDLSKAGERREAMAQEYDKYQEAQRQSQLSQLDKVEQGVFNAVLDMTGDRKQAGSIAQMARQNPDMAKAVMTQMAEQRYQEATSASQNALDMGLKPGTPEYNQYIKDATIKKGTSVNIKNEPTIPADHKAIRDKDGNLTGYELIEGSPTWQKQELKRRDTIFDGRKSIMLVDRALDQTGFWTAGLGSYLAAVEGTPAADLKNTLETLQAEQAFDSLTAMREASPTGGALGNVSNVELNLLEKSVISLARGQSPKQLTDNLNFYKAMLERNQFIAENADVLRQMPGDEQVAFIDKETGTTRDGPKKQSKDDLEEKYGLK